MEKSLDVCNLSQDWTSKSPTQGFVLLSPESDSEVLPHTKPIESDTVKVGCLNKLSRKF